MEKLSEHEAWYKICPQLPYSKCGNIMITIVTIILMPLILLIVPIVYAFMIGFYFVPIYFNRGMRKRKRVKNACCRWTIAYALSILIILRLSIAVAVISSVLLVVLGILPAWFLCLSYIWRLTLNTF